MRNTKFTHPAVFRRACSSASGPDAAGGRAANAAPVCGGLRAFAADTNTHTPYSDYYAALERYAESGTTSLFSHAYFNDTATAKIDIFTGGEAAREVSVTSGAFINGSAETLDCEVSFSFIHETRAYDTGKYVPDVLSGCTAEDIAPFSVKSVWISVKTPPSAAPGRYTSTLSVSSSGEVCASLTYTVELIALALPDVAESGVQLELWQYPYACNRYYSGKTTREYFADADNIINIRLDDGCADALRSQSELYAAAGGRAITVTVTEDPWNSQTPDPYPSMVKWTRGSDGKFSFDYTDFDKWVELNLRCGVNRRIKSFSIADWANRITYYDRTLGRTATRELTPGSREWVDVWTQFLHSYTEHTLQKGWYDMVYMSMDERPYDVIKAVLDVVESVRTPDGSCFKTSLAVFKFDAEELFDRVTDLSLAIAMDPERVRQICAHRRGLGLTTTLYACGAQAGALSNEPCEVLYSLWYCKKCGADGFLRWALDAFCDSPLEDTEHLPFAAGDIFLIYPDRKTSSSPAAKSSVRFEKLAEGCRDIAKINLLYELISKLSEKSASKAGAYKKKLDGLIASVGGDPRNQILPLQKSLAELSHTLSEEKLI